MKVYYGTKRIEAWPEARDGQEGYGVRYEDGYESWSPKDVFDAAYAPEDGGMNFGHALAALKEGRKVQRAGWNGVGLWLELQVPDAHSKMTLPYIFIAYPASAKNTPGARVPWLASQTDMLADDWQITEGESQ